MHPISALGMSKVARRNPIVALMSILMLDYPQLPLGPEDVVETMLYAMRKKKNCDVFMISGAAYLLPRLSLKQLWSYWMKKEFFIFANAFETRLVFSLYKNSRQAKELGFSLNQKFRAMSSHDTLQGTSRAYSTLNTKKIEG